MNSRLLIFTDLDGSLLDHKSYSHSAAASMLERLKKMGVPVILASSKTRSELIAIRGELDNSHPFIVENGAAVLIPDGYFDPPPADAHRSGDYWVTEFCAPRAHWLALLKRQRRNHSGEFLTFAESGTKQIREMTGLNVIAAERAASREYGEPVRWLASAARREQFIDAVEKSGARVLMGGRFLHVSGDIDKGRALRWLRKAYERNGFGARRFTIAVGDGQNDVAMLDAADQALIVRSRVHEPPKLTRTSGVVVSEKFGPEGWREGLAAILDTLPRELTG